MVITLYLKHLASIETEVHVEYVVLRQYRHALHNDGGYVLRNVSLGDFVIVRTVCAYTNLESITYYTPRLYGIAYCS